MSPVKTCLAQPFLAFVLGFGCIRLLEQVRQGHQRGRAVSGEKSGASLVVNISDMYRWTQQVQIYLIHYQYIPEGYQSRWPQ